MFGGKCMIVHIGTQAFGLAKEMTADLPGTIKALHEIGFDTIEPFILFKKKQGRMPGNLWALDTLEEAKRMMDELGMTIPSVHIGIGFGKFSMPVNSVIKNILSVHQKTGITYFIVSGPFGDRATAEKWGRILRKISEGIRPYGCRVVYHNHDDEFHRQTADGTSAEVLEYFFDIAGPDVLLQLDIGWAGFAGDEIAAAKRYRDRICSIHLKDFYPSVKKKNYTRNSIPAQLFAPIGEGCIRTAEILQMRDTFPCFNGSILIDQDKYDGNMLDSLGTGYGNIQKMLGEPEMNHGHCTDACGLRKEAGSVKNECTEAGETVNAPARDRFSLMTFPLAEDFIKKTMTIQDSLMLAKETGLHSVDVMNVKSRKVPEYRKAMSFTGIRIKCYISTITFFDRKEKIEKELNREMSVARALGAPLFMIVPYYPVINVKRARKMGRDKVRRLLLQGFRLAVEKGKSYGLKVCFETTPQEEICLSGTEDCLYILKRVPGLSLVFDTANMLPHGDTTLEAYEALKKYIIHVHLKDVELKGGKASLLQSEISADGRIMTGAVWGEGVIPVKEVYERMLSDGYQGSFAVEYVHPAGGACGLAAHKEQLARFFHLFE